MKGKRRHELKSNDLAAALADFGQFFQSWGVYVVGGVAVVVVVAFIVTYMGSARADAIDQAYWELMTTEQQATPSQQAPRTDAELQQALDKVSDLVDRTNDEQFKVQALAKRGDMALNAAMSGQTSIRPEFLDEAAQAYERVVDQYRSHVLHYGKALYGLYLVEADRFAVDQDSSHRDKAAGYLEKIRDDSRLSGTPYAKLAIGALNNIDETFQPIRFPEAPAATPAPVTAPFARDPDAPLPSPGGFDTGDEAQPQADQPTEEESGQSMIDEPTTETP